MKNYRVLIFCGLVLIGIGVMPGWAAFSDRSIQDLQLTTELDSKTQSVKLHVRVLLAAISSPSDWSQSSLALELFDPQANSIAQTTIAWFEPQGQESIGRAILPVANPLFWTAETPFLYRLNATLATPGHPDNTINIILGFRQISTDQGILALQGVPIHLRGILYSESHSKTDESLPEERWQEDLLHMKNANINAIRTTDSPPHPRFLELCDEQGFYVIPDLSFQEASQSEGGRIEGLVSQYRNHPCILAWSMGEQPAWSDELERVIQSVKTLDPSRPLLVPGLADASFPLDILAPLNPSLDEVRGYSRLKRPVIFASHTPAMGNALEGLEEMAQWVRDHRNLAGGMLAQFADDEDADEEKAGEEDIVSATSSSPSTVSRPKRWGILNTDRTPQLDFWQVRRVYSPIQMNDQEIRVKPGPQSLELQMENHYDFTNLRDHSGQWFLLCDGRPILNRALVVDLEPGKRMQLAATFELPDDLADHDYTLRYQFSDPTKRIVFEHGIRLRAQNWQKDFILRMRDLEWDKDWKVTADPLRAQIDHKNFSFIIQLATSGWFMRTQEHNVRLITGGPYIRTGHSILRSLEGFSLSSDSSSPAILSHLWADYKEMEKIETNIELHTRFVESPTIQSATQPTEKGAQAKIDILSSPFGYCDIRFSIAMIRAHPVQELGLSFLVPPTMNEIAWLGNGPSPTYPGQSQLATWGLFRFNPLSDCLPGNRSQVDLLGIRDERGYGLGIVMYDGDFSVEPVAEGTLITINAAVAGLGNGAQTTRYPLSDDQLRGNGSTAFRLIPLIRNRYPAMFKGLWAK